MRKTPAAKAAKSFEIANRRREVARLKRQGKQQKEIAELIGVSEATIATDVAAIKEQLHLGSVEELMQLVTDEARTLDEDEAAIRDLLLSSPSLTSVLQSYSMILSIMRRRAGLLGLDADARSKHDQGAATRELDDLLREIDGGK